MTWQMTPLTAPAFGTPFAESYQASRGPESPGLEAQNERWRAMTGATIGKPAPSVLAQARLSNVASNASAPSMADRVLPDGSTLPSPNGTAEQTYDADNQLRMRGVLPL
jgi:hypothetical protein